MNTIVPATTYNGRTTADLTGLPEGAVKSFTRNGDGTYTVTLHDSYTAHARDTASRLAVVDKLDTLPDHTISEVAPLFPQWRQPEGAHDAYPEGVIVRWDGALWRSTTPDNVWAPGESGWHRYGAEPDAGPQPWVQPTGSHDAYQQGDEVTHGGQTWRSDIDGNVWEPPTYWTAVD